MVLPWFLSGSESLFGALMACFDDVLEKSEKGLDC
jgi:hypothetical protein